MDLIEDRSMSRIPFFLLPVLLFAPPPGHASAPLLTVAGKPRIGQELRFEVLAPGAPQVFLVLDTQPGPVTLKGTTVGIGFSSDFQLLGLGPGSPQPMVLTGSVPVDTALVGQSFYVEAWSYAPLEASGAERIELGAPLPIDQVDDYAYQLEGPGGTDLALPPIASSAFDLCIVDFARDGLDQFGAGEIAALKSAAEPDRLRIAYLSIGEAEDYRWYWGSLSAGLIIGPNPDWPGNYRVRYWEPEWREVLLHGNAAVGKSYLDRIIDQGFDGVFLDVVDVFESIGPAGAGGSNLKRDAARQMIDLILAIAHHARLTRGRPDFLVMPQNGANIFETEWYPANTLGPNDPQTPAAMAAFMRDRLLASVDAIAVEDIFYFGNQDMNNPLNPQTYLIGLLTQWQAAGLPVLATEYLSNSNKINALYTNHAPGTGYVPYATARDLDELRINPGHEPD